MSRTTYLVVVYPVSPARSTPNTFSSNTSSTTAPRVKKVTASTAQEAASTAGVQAGEHALVAAERDLKRFDRALQAPLEQTDPSNGRYLPTVSEAA